MAFKSEHEDGPLRQSELVEAVRERLGAKTAGRDKIIAEAKHCKVVFFAKGRPKKIPE